MAKRKRLQPARNIASDRPAPSEPVRGPLAAVRPPIADVAHDAAASAALTEVTAELAAAREDGRLIQRLPLDAIIDDHLMRDRITDQTNRDEMEALIDSLRRRGQQTAIEVTAVGDRFGLISGWRRLTALRELHRENPELDTVLAIVRAPSDQAEAYQSMIEENEVRVGLSFYERARIVVRAVEGGVFRADKAALQALFASVPRAKRSKINAFLPIVRTFDGLLPYPTALTEKQGLALAKALEADAAVIDRVLEALSQGIDSPADQSAAIDSALRKTPDDGPAKTRAEDVRQIGPNITMTVHGGGKVTITGDRLKDPEAVLRLQDMLEILA